jgi:predicted RNA-binding Zn ribbon-like protein
LSSDFGGVQGALVDSVSAPTDEAPGRLELVRLFENTIELPNGPDELDRPERAAAWCRSHGLPPVCNPAEAEQLRQFREGLRDVLFANNGEGEVAGAWESLRPFTRLAQLRVTVDRVRGLGLKAAGPHPASAIASILAIVYDAIVDGTWRHLRACRKSSCRFAYYDRTKNGSRAWCNMKTCGNQAKAARRRQRVRHAQFPAAP